MSSNPKYMMLSFMKEQCELLWPSKAHQHENYTYDVTIVGDDFKINAHKIVLASASNFLHNVLDKTQSEHATIFMKDIPYRIFQFVFNFMYTGEIRIQKREVSKFLEVCRELSIKGLQCGSKFASKTEVNTSEINSCCSKKYSVNDHKEGTCIADTEFVDNSTEINQRQNMSKEDNCKSFKSPAVYQKQKVEISNSEKLFAQRARSKIEGKPGYLIPLGKISLKALKEDIWQCNMCRRTFPLKPEAVTHLQQAHRIAKGSIYFKNITKVV